jgi:Carboxypeptidase regulatory-like domain
MTTRHFWRVLCVLLLGVLPAVAQTQADISGVIRDATGAVVPGVMITVTNPATNFARSAISNEAGVYNFPVLQPGRYSIRVELPGFRTITQNDVELQVQQSARLDFTLQVGELSETVEVAGTTALIATENATVGTVIENRRIVDMPLNGRNFLQLVSLSPNVSYGFNSAGQAGDRQGGTRAQQNIAVAGQRSSFNHFTLDGVENTDVNFNTYVVLPSIDALQEFKVQTGIFPAEFGRATTQINVSTKPGTNDFHGTLFEFLRNDVLDAKQYAFAGKRDKDPLRWNQYGFTLGGPVWLPKIYKGTDRLFFMSNFEGFKERRTSRMLFTVPSVKMRNGDFSEVSTPIFDPRDRTQQFLGNVIPKERIHPTSAKLLEFYPAPNLNPGLVSLNHEAVRRRVVDKDQFIQRVDFVESSKSSWFGRYSYGNETEIQPVLYLNGSKVLTTVHQAMFSNTRVLSPSMVNEFRGGYNYFFNSKGTELANIRDVMSELKIPGIAAQPGLAWGTPAIVITGFTGFGDSSEGPYANKNHIYQVIDNFSWTTGNHTLRTGLEIRWDQYNQVGNQFARGSFGFEPNATSRVGAAGTGNAFADFLLGYCKRCEASVSLATVNFRATSQYYYVDDTWKIHPKVSLNFGLRYEFTPAWFDKSGKLVNIEVPYIDTTPNVADPARHPTLVRMGTGDFYEGIPLRFDPRIKVARDGRLGRKLVADDKNDFAPRLGVSWNPSSKWVVRTGAGFFYSQDTGNPRFDMSRNLAGRRRDESTPDQIDLTWDQPFRSLGGTVLITNPYVLGNIYRRHTPYSIQYLLNIQRELGGNTALEVGYMGSVSRKLESLRAFNESLPGATGTVLERAPYPEFGRIQEVDGSGRANYNSLGVKLQRRFSRGLTYLFGYTWSRSIDTGSAIRNHAGDTLFPQNSYNLGAERALSSFHTAHRTVTSVLYELPIGKGRRFLNRGGIADAALGGWQLGSIVMLQSGFPYTVTSGKDQSNTGAGFDRPNATGLNPVLPRDERTTDRWFNTDAFRLQPFGTFGNVGRNTLISPGMFQWDFSVHKEFRFLERQAVQFRFEAFNFSNHPNWGNPGANLSMSNFGKISSTRTNMRELQFALKYMF